MPVVVLAIYEACCLPFFRRDSVVHVVLDAIIRALLVPSQSIEPMHANIERHAEMLKALNQNGFRL